MSDETTAVGFVEGAIRAGIVAVFAAGIRRRDPGSVANAVPALVGTYVPDGLERRYDVEFRPWQRVYVDVSMLAHAVGMLGPYDETRWWDSVTHVLSATILGSVVHAVARRRGRDPRRAVVTAVAGLGVAWELLEYGSHALAGVFDVEPVLVPYSARDTAGDLLYDLVGALVVLALGDRLLENFTPPGD